MKRFCCVAAVALWALTTPAVAEDRKLNIYDWADIFSPELLARFSAEAGAQVTYDTYDSDEALETKLLTGGSGYDIVGPGAQPFLSRQVRAGVLRELDRGRIPNWGNLDPGLMTLLGQADPGNRHATILGWGTTALGYNVDAVARRLPGVPLDSYDLLFKPENVSRLADCGVAMVDSPNDVIPIALRYLGLDPASETPDDLRRAEELLTSIRPYLKYVDSSLIINDLAGGNICLVLGWSGDVVTARNRAVEAGNGVHVDHLIPKEGTLVWIATLAIPADAPDPETAHDFLNFMLDPKSAAEMTRFTGYGNAVPASHAFLPAEVLNDPAIFPPQAVRDSLFLLGPSSPGFDRLRTRSWTRFRTGQ